MPGDEISYFNTGYILLAEIIERVTKDSFSVWMRDSIFTPLGMVNKYVEDNPRRIVANNTSSNNILQDNNIERAIDYWGYTGSGNIHSNSNDLLIWLRNFHNPQNGWEDSFKKILTVETLNNGDENNYAFGIVIDSLNGYKRIQHGGGVGGYRSFICSYPSEALDIVVLTNFSS